MRITVSDHAIVRYLERVEGIDIKAIKKKILPVDDRRLMDAIHTLGYTGTYPVGTNHRIRLEDAKVVTVLEP